MDSTIEDEFVTAASQLDDSRDEVSHLLSNCSHSPSCLSTETAFSNAHRDQSTSSNLLADGHSCSVDAVGPWHPKYFSPPVSGCRMPGVAKAVLPVLVAVGRSLVCFALSLAFFALVALLIPFRFLFYLIGRFSNLPLFHRTFYKRHCDPLWPFGSPPDRHHATTSTSTSKHHRRHQPSLYYLLSLSLDSGLDLKALQDFLLQRLLLCTSRHALICCDPDGATQSSKPFPIEDHFCVSMPEQQQSNDDDDAGASLEQTLNQLIKSTLPDQWRVYMMSTRSLAPTTSMNVLIQSTWADACLCPLQLLSMIGGDQHHLVQSSVKIEPKIFFTVPCAFGMFTSFILTIACATQDMLNGPINLLASMVTSVHPVWNDLIEFRGLPSSLERGESQTKWKLTWTKITSLDQVLRLCKILRCSIQELLLSVLAGALRRHFRSRGIRHPPAIVISLPIDIGKQQQQQQKKKGASAAEEMRQNCDRCVVVPLKLPVDVDGAVPRIWKTQEALNSTLDSSFPQAATFFLNTISTVLPASLAHRCARMLYKSSEGLVSFLQVEKNYHLCGRNLNTLLLFPVVGEMPGWARRKFACTLTHLNSEIYVSLNVDPRHFHEPKQLVGYMQNEIQHLLAQMGARLLNLSEVSYLPCFLRNAKLNSPPPPAPAPSVSRTIAPVVSSCSSSSTAVVSGDTVEISMEVVSAGGSHKRKKKSKKVSVGDLERLLGEVQSDLHSIKTSHFPDRSSYISRLDQLERKMALFQRGLSSVVNKAATLPEEENGDSFKLKALVNIYNNEHLSSNDKDQDSAVGDHRIRPLRKKSRRLSSPTRINAMLSHHQVL